ncbi:maleylpyruvate isomerase N-terminal domain-containing protein [Actinomadura citrea]|uniref:Mycothiol-dependent maleylpyruvate isomerase metal-binding domain-containing protein n=1 Tax=Actinomadura citrea TaxID=46158 RepID=A0A7Y9KHC7_9ACTN|nr:maleylpyruvate isomerase N-terminal domain-containing protein [Actinomadura citrea]NYE17421.1 hypothetical protein [Actinomadura citrea]GGU00889.1 hypothetical protein GCM10010177_70090 [Actinomadura citrea]
MTTAPTAHSGPAPAPTTPWTGLLRATADECLDLLSGAAGSDWTRPAHDLDWTCRETLDHLALGLIGYAGLLIARPSDRYIALFASLDAGAPIPACLEGIGIATSLLASAVRETPADARAWHPWGHSDRTGFAAMGITELVCHTYDIAHALGVRWTPPDEASAAVLDRLFPDAPTAHAPSDALLWCTGRVPLPERPRQANWQWNGTVR